MSDQTTPNPTPPDGSAKPDAIEASLKETQDAIDSVKPTSDARPEQERLNPDKAGAFELPSFQAGAKTAEPQNIDLLGDVTLNVKIELGRTRMLVEDVLKLNEGAVVELDKLAGDPVDVYVNERLVARGEVLVLNDNFCVRVHEIVDPKIEEQRRSA